MLGYIPDLHPDELIYSVWARFSDQVHYPSAGGVFEDLFGDRAVSPTIDLPCHLQKFYNNLPPGAERELDIDTIIDQHTLLPYYQPFLSLERYLAIRHQMMMGSARAIHQRLGILGSSVIRPAYLRYCPCCLNEEKATFGESYWHRLHQVPGVEICPEHDVFLENSPFSVNSGLVRKPFAPAEWITNPAVARDARSSPFYGQLIDIAINSSYLLNHALKPVDAVYVWKQYQSLLAKQRYLTLTGEVRSSQLVPDFQNCYPESLLALLHCEVDQPLRRRNTWPIKLVRAKKSQHPLYHILMLLFLKSSAQQFFQELLSDHRSAPFGPGPWPCLNPICPYYMQLHIRACRIRQIAKSTYSGVFACDCGFEYTRVISEAAPDDMYRYNSILAYGQLWEHTLSMLWKDLQLTADQIAQRLGVSVITLNRKVKLLNLPPRQQRPEHKSKLPSEDEITSHREKWLKTLAAYPNQGICVAIRQSEGSYFWLRRWDRAWLDVNLPPRKVPQPSNSWPVQDDLATQGRGERNLSQTRKKPDQATAKAIRRKAKELLDAPGEPQKVTRRKLRQAIPSFSHWPNNAASLPLTQEALDEVLESTEHFAIRRIHWVAQQCLDERITLTRYELIRKAGVDRQQHKPEVQAAIQEAMRVCALLD